MSRPDPAFLPYGRQLIDEADVAAVAEVLRGDFLTTGPAVEAFESALAERVGAPHAVACSSGTTALHLAALGLGLGEGDVAVVPSMTFLATANCLRHAGAEVAFADVDPETGLATPETLSEALARAGDAARALFVVHLNGQCCDMEGIAEIAKAKNLAVVEDACHALGAGYGADGSIYQVGDCAHSDAAVFSFHPVKAMTSGEGGMVTTNDPDMAKQMAELRHHGMVRDPQRFADREAGFDSAGALNPWYHEMSELGFNYRMSDIHAALGASQLAKIDGFLEARRALVAAYDERLATLAPIVRPLARVAACAPAWHLYVVHIDFAAAGVSRSAVMGALRERGVGSQVHYIPVHRQPYYRARYGEIELPGAEAYYARALSLPLYPAMSEADTERVVDALAASLGLAGAWSRP